MINLPRLSPVSVDVEQLLACRQLRLGMPPWRNVRSSRHGQRLSRVRGRGMEFDEVRQYQAGDDVRSIDWRVTARTGKPHTKLFREDREHPVFIYLDLSSSMLFGSEDKLKSVMATEAAACLGWRAQGLGERIALMINLGHQQIVTKPSANTNQWLAELQQMAQTHNQQFARYQAGGLNQQHPYEAAFAKLLHLVKTGYQVHLISDFYHLRPKDSPLLQRLAQHNQVFSWQVIDPLEQALPSSHHQHSLEVSRGGKTGFLRPNHTSFNQKYSSKAQLRQQKIEHFMQSLGVPLQTFSSSKDWNDYAR